MNPTKLTRETPINPIHVNPIAGKGEPIVLPPFVTVEEKLKKNEKNNNPSKTNAMMGPITNIQLDVKPSLLPDSIDILTDVV